jgi:hypothetical protein
MGYHENYMEEKKEQRVCLWIGDGECCRRPTIYRKSYCEEHYSRIYDTFYEEMADYLIEREIEK